MCRRPLGPVHWRQGAQNRIQPVVNKLVPSGEGLTQKNLDSMIYLLLSQEDRNRFVSAAV